MFAAARLLVKVALAPVSVMALNAAARDDGAEQRTERTDRTLCKITLCFECPDLPWGPPGFVKI